MSLTCVRKWRFIRIIYYYNYVAVVLWGVLLLLLLLLLLFFCTTVHIVPHPLYSGWKLCWVYGHSCLMRFIRNWRGQVEGA